MLMNLIEVKNYDTSDRLPLSVTNFYVLIKLFGFIIVFLFKSIITTIF